MSHYKRNKENMEEDINKNLLILNKNHCEIEISCNKCSGNEANVIFLSNQERIENKEIGDDLKYKKRVWKMPWFLSIMCFLQILAECNPFSGLLHPSSAFFVSIYQISLYCIANACVRQQFMFMPETINEYWRYITYMLLHSDVLHLSMNMCLQLLIGFCLESEQGHLKVAYIYITGGIAGSLATFYLQPQLSLMGASAGVYAMLMSHIPHLLKNFYKLPHRYLRICAVVILFVSDVCFSTFHVLINHNMHPRICLEAHAAGGISGMLFGFLIYSTTSENSTTIRRRLKSGDR